MEQVPCDSHLHLDTFWDTCMHLSDLLALMLNLKHRFWMLEGVNLFRAVRVFGAS